MSLECLIVSYPIISDDNDGHNGNDGHDEDDDHDGDNEAHDDDADDVLSYHIQADRL